MNASRGAGELFAPLRPLDLVALTADVPEPDRSLTPAGFVVDVDGARIHFLDWSPAGSVPANGPGLLLIHGLAQTAWAWTPIARRLARALRVVAMDLRGHGLSDAPTEGYSLAHLAEDALAVIDGSGLADGGPVLIAGHGFGAGIAAWAAGALEAGDGGRSGGLALVDGGWDDVAASSGLDVDEFMRALDEPPEVMRSMEAFLADRRDFDPPTWDADQEQAARATVVAVPAGHVVPAIRPHALAASVRAMFAYRPSIVVPVLHGPVVALLSDDPEGTRRAELARLAAARRAAGRSPLALAAFPGAGHNLMRYRPEGVSAALLGLARTIGE